MAIKANAETMFGENRDLYIRLNNAEVCNHGVPSVALFRGFASEEAYRGGKPFMWERTVEFTADVNESVWSQAYSALKALPELEGAQDA